MLQRIKWLPVSAAAIAAAGTILTLAGVWDGTDGIVVLIASLVLAVLSLGTR